jgi:hypothetical protein
VEFAEPWSIQDLAQPALEIEDYLLQFTV